MDFDFTLFSGFSMMALKKPTKPIQTNPPDATTIFLHTGEDAGKYQTFIEAISDLAQAFKFLPKYDQMRYQYGDPLLLLSKNDSAITVYVNAMLSDAGTGPFELTYKDADGVTDVTANFSKDDIVARLSVYLDSTASFDDRIEARRILQAFSKYFFANDTFSKQASPGNPDVSWGWGDGKAYSNLEFSPDASDWNLLDGISTGSGQSFYEIAKSGAIDGYSPEQAFDLMCSMLESKERVFGRLESIFGGADGLGNDTDVIDHITLFLNGFDQIDPHNLGILKMFFGMQTDFINTLDAYMNCKTFWGGDGTNNLLMSKVDSYISALSDDKKLAAQALESKWFAASPRWDKVGDKWTGELVGTNGSWVEFFCDKMDKFNADEVTRIVVGRIMNRSLERKYKREKAEYEDKKEDLIQQEIFLMKMQAKQFAQAKASFRKLLGRKSKTSRVGRIKGRRISPIAARRASRVAARPSAPVVRHAHNRAIAAGLARRNAQAAAVAPRVHASVAVRSASQPIQAKKHSKDEKKVI